MFEKRAKLHQDLLTFDFFSIFLFFKKTLNIGEKIYFLRKIAKLDTFYGNFWKKNGELKNFSVQFFFIVQLADFMTEKLKCWMNTCPSIFQMENNIWAENIKTFDHITKIDEKWLIFLLQQFFYSCWLYSSIIATMLLKR